MVDKTIKALYMCSPFTFHGGEYKENETQTLLRYLWFYFFDINLRKDVIDVYAVLEE